jgi:hypothetical protein
LNDFAAALRDLNESGIRYVIVGELAVIRHGVVRATKDVDAAIAMDKDNLARLETLVCIGTPRARTAARCRPRSSPPAASCPYAHLTAWWTSYLSSCSRLRSTTPDAR